MRSKFIQGIKGLSAGITSLPSHPFFLLGLVALGDIAPIAYKRLEMSIGHRSYLALTLQTLQSAHQ